MLSKQEQDALREDFKCASKTIKDLIYKRKQEEMVMSVVSANDFKSTADSRTALLAKLSKREQKMFKDFVKSVSGG